MGVSETDFFGSDRIFYDYISQNVTGVLIIQLLVVMLMTVTLPLLPGCDFKSRSESHLRERFLRLLRAKREAERYRCNPNFQAFMDLLEIYEESSDIYYWACGKLSPGGLFKSKLPIKCEKIKFFNPSTNLFGPAYSSDNAGDGPELSVKLSDLPTYTSKDHLKWEKDFQVFLPAECTMLLTLTEQALRMAVVSPSDNPTQLTETRKADNQLYKCIYKVLMDSKDTKAVSLSAMISNENCTLNGFKSGFLAWRLIRKFHSETTPQDKLSVISDFFSMTQDLDEEPEAFKNRLERSYQLIKAQNITDEEIIFDGFIGFQIFNSQDGDVSPSDRYSQN